MKDVIFLAVTVLIASGCGYGSSVPSGKPGSRPSVVKGRTANWDPSLFEGGSMFADAKEFEDYVHRADNVATGVLTAWDGTQGSVRLESVLHGNLTANTVSVIATGGIVHPTVGDRVVILLSGRDGKMKLHSFCSASGLYKYSSDMTDLINGSLSTAD